MENRVKDFSRILQSCFYFLDICKLHETMIKIPHFFDFILLRFDGKRWNHRIKYALYKYCTFKILHYFI